MVSRLQTAQNPGLQRTADAASEAGHSAADGKSCHFWSAARGAIQHKKMVILKRLLVSTLVATTVMMTDAALAKSSAEVLSRAEIKFQPLNPARGGSSPKAEVLWGDIGENVPTGELIEFADGFSSPPHIHNVTYRAVMISRADDDPEAKQLVRLSCQTWQSYLSKAGTGAAKMRRTAEAPTSQPRIVSDAD